MANAKSLRKRSLAAVIAAVLAAAFLPLQTVLAAPIADTPTGVYGRVLSKSLTGDTSDWVEVARNGDFSLIVRKECLMSLGKVKFDSRDINAYSISDARNYVNNWFKQTLGSQARLRDFTVKNNALTDLGGFAVTSSGFSKPAATADRTGDDVAFLLSFAEAASFCSIQYATSTTTVTASSALAANNFNMLTRPGDGYMEDFWWLRSPGNTSGTYKNVCSIGTHTSSGLLSDGTVYGSTAQAGYPYIRPALWVGSAVFETTVTVTYDANGGTGAPVSHTITQNGSGKLSLTAPSRSGFTFKGWAASGTATTAQYQPGGTISVGTANITLYAVWQQNKATVIVIHRDADDGRILKQDEYVMDGGAYGPYAQRQFPNYQYWRVASGSDPVSGTVVSDEIKTVIFEYTKWW